jgi:hypothetical protein
MPLGPRRPFVVGVLPRPLRRDGKNGELRAVVVPRLTLLRICADEAAALSAARAHGDANDECGRCVVRAGHLD